MLLNNRERCDEVRVADEVIVVNCTNVTALNLRLSRQVSFTNAPDIRLYPVSAGYPATFTIRFQFLTVKKQTVLLAYYFTDYSFLIENCAFSSLGDPVVLVLPPVLPPGYSVLTQMV